MKTISIRLRSIPFIISAPAKAKSKDEGDKLAAFARLEASGKLFSESIDCAVERQEI